MSSIHCTVLWSLLGPTRHPSPLDGGRTAMILLRLQNGLSHALALTNLNQRSFSTCLGFNFLSFNLSDHPDFRFKLEANVKK
jgi:hypothetical protein